MQNFQAEREEIAYFMRRLYEKNLTTSSGGNISQKIGDRILITPAKLDKGRLEWQNVCVISEDGKENFTPEINPTSEILMHLEIYKKRKDISVIFHSHPVFSSIFSISEDEFRTDLTGEARLVLKEVAFAEYALTGTSLLAELTAKGFNRSDVVIMKNHGAATVGNTLFEAFDKIEVLEMTAKLNFLLGFLKTKKPLNKKQVEEIDKLSGFILKG